LEKSSLRRAAGSLLRRSFAPAAVFCILLAIVNCDAYEEGGQSGAYLRLPMGATATALGGAYTALADYYAAWWNPSALGFLRENRIAGGAGVRSLGRMEGFGSIDFRVPPRVGVGLAVLYRGDPHIDNLHDLEENVLPSAAYTTMTVKCAVSYYINRKLSAGIATNYFFQSIPDYDLSGGIRNVTSSTLGAFDLAVTYRQSDALTFVAMIQNLAADFEWQFGDAGSGESSVSDKPLRCLVLAGVYKTTLAEKPLVWAFDGKNYLFDSTWSLRDHPEILLNTGVEWRGWETFYLRAGLGDIPLNGTIAQDAKAYYNEFGLRFSLGFSREMTEIKKGLWLNYAVATDKVWAGVDQQLDVTYSF
jgi:hypothetical protein